MSIKEKLTNVQLMANREHKKDNGKNNFSEEKKNKMRKKDNVKE